MARQVVVDLALLFVAVVAGLAHAADSPASSPEASAPAADSIFMTPSASPDASDVEPSISEYSPNILRIFSSAPNAAAPEAGAPNAAGGPSGVSSAASDDYY
ncbi:hypothetical protein K7X08_033590 [Anisodus acutangulus]|uniref:Uncharacterized protein n=1 Tax=Anisodus acutangulus TaxID=402998 RepID=A0A9Q1M2C5_9SOLA|nr:hypothetical protein K7X08_033590 [Anisodus acutangulus]